MPGLTSLTLIVLLAVVLAGTLVAALWGWPRLARPGARRVALRLAALIVIEVATVCLTFAVVNRANVFYTSWSDLLGRYAGGGVLSAAHERGASAGAPVVVLAAEPVRLPGRTAPEGTLEQVRLRGRLSGLSVRGNIYLPPGYSARASRRSLYPVIVAISSRQSSTSWRYGASALAVAAAGQIASGRLEPLILVTLPAGTRADPGCVNVPAGPQDGLFFAQDLRSALASRYRVSTQRTAWGLLGDASGGYCALQVALTSASDFAAVAVPPGDYRRPPGRPVWGRSPQLRLQDNLLWLVRHQPMQPVALLLTGYPAGPFLSLARGPMTAESVTLGQGRSALGPVLDWLGAMLGHRGTGL